MKLSTHVKPVSQLKARATEMIRSVAEDRQPVMITINGEARAVLQDIASYEQAQETLALLKILALTTKSVEDGHVRPFVESFAGIRARLKD